MTIVESLNEKQISDIAYKLRDLIGMKKHYKFPIVEFVENVLLSLDDTYGFNVAEIDDPEIAGMYAFYNPKENEMTIRSDVYEQALNGDGTSRFTIAHELGHYILHRKGIRMCSISDDFEVNEEYDPEWQANKFASAILMPEYLIGNMSKEEVASRFGTSLQAAEISCNKGKKAKHNTA